MSGQSQAAPLAQAWGGATVPLVMNYQGELKDMEGNPLSGYYTMTFRIYHDVIAPITDSVWSETHISVTVRSGHFSVLLGNIDPDNNSLPFDLFRNPDRFVGVTVAPYDEMVPRQRFASVPYAFYSSRAGGLSASDGEPVDAVTVDAQGRVAISGSVSVRNGTDHIAFESLEASHISEIRWGDDTDDRLRFLFEGWDVGTREVMALTANGNVGIGTTTPWGKLAINNSFDEPSGRANHLYLTDAVNLNLKGYIGLNRNSAAGADQEYLSIEGVEEGVHWLDIVLAADEGNVGIGTTNPSAKLDVAGDTTIGGDLSVLGNFANFAIHGPWTASGRDGHDQYTSMDANTGRNFCFLTETRVEQSNSLSHQYGCKIFVDHQNKWSLWAQAAGESNSYCEARCFSW